MSGQYVIVRSTDSGVFAGTLSNGETLGTITDATSITLYNARRLWYWAGAATLSQLAVTGTSKPGNCKFPTEVPSIRINQVCEILEVTLEAQMNIASVPVWSA